MAIQKQEFYEGAALHCLLRGNSPRRVSSVPPYFDIDQKVRIHLKYSTAGRSPWGFSFPAEEQRAIAVAAKNLPLVIGLICGSDGVAALPYDRYKLIAQSRTSAVWISCSRRHREHFEVSGPDGKLPTKIPPSAWRNLLDIDWNLEGGLSGEPLR